MGRARSLRLAGSAELMEQAGFVVETHGAAPMHLVRPRRMIAGEGPFGAPRIAKNTALNPAARKRILAMREVVETDRDTMAAIHLVTRKPG